MKKVVVAGFLYFFSIGTSTAQIDGINSLFQYREGWKPRWSSPENLNGLKGQGGKENNGAKGHPFDTIGAGKSLTLLDVKGMGMINRIWITNSAQSGEMLRALKIEIFWDNEKKPAVSAPLGDFFGGGLGKKVAFENALFADPEGRSFNCFIQMPFKTGAKIVVTNESSVRVDRFFFDVDYNYIPKWNNDYMYFHAYWHRDTSTQLARDFEVLPRVTGKGRFLGVNISMISNPLYNGSWWGEGEVKVYLDGDNNYPTLNGTGTEDYIGTAWGQGKFINQYTGCLIADDSLKQWSFYRYHIPDPMFFGTDCKVALQQLGGTFTEIVAGYQHRDLPVIPAAIDNGSGRMINFYNRDSTTRVDTIAFPKTWINFYRKDDVSAVAYFYLKSPVNNLPALQPAALRIYGIKK